MGWINARVLPDSSSAYKQWFSGFGSWPGWIYGLPGTATSTDCGALPFREDAELSSINSPNCLRGEDWAFIASVQAESTSLPDPYIYNSARPAVLTVRYNVAKADLSNAYTFLSGWSAMGAWGEDVAEISSRAWAIGSPDLGFPSYPGVSLAEYKITRESIINRLAVTMSNPSTTGDTLSLSAMQDMFADYRQLRWTIQSIPPSYFGTGASSWDAVLYEGGLSGGVDLPERDTSLLSAHSRDNPGLPSTQLVEADVNLYACVTVSQSVTDNRGNSNLSAWHYVFLPVRSGMVWANSQSDWDNYLHAFATSGGALSGKTIAQAACDFLGVPLVQTPAPLDPGIQTTPWSKTTVTLHDAYLQIGQRWLVAYQ